MDSKLLDLVQSNISLFWDIDPKSLDQLSDDAILERFLMYGCMSDIRKIVEIWGMDKCAEIFNRLISKKRINLRSATVNFFKLYFEPNAS